MSTWDRILWPRVLLAALAVTVPAACTPVAAPADLAALPPGSTPAVPPGSTPAVPILVSPPPVLQIVDPPVEPGSPVAVVRGEPRPVVFYQQPDRISPPGTPLVLPPPIPRGDRQETLVEGVPTRLVVGRGALSISRFHAALNQIGRGRLDALHLELHGGARTGAVAAAARRAGIDPLKIRVAPESAGGHQVVVIVTRFVATAPVCPSLAIIGPSANENDFEPTLGCSSRRNLAAMINDPADLLKNDAVVPSDGARAGAAIERYHNPSGNGRSGGRSDGYGPAAIDPGSALGSVPGVLGPGGPVAH